MTEKIINGVKIFHIEETASTNRIAMEKENAEHLCCIVADRQSGGRGRLGRSFFSPSGGLYLSVIIDPEKLACGLSFCTAAAALAVKDALEKSGIRDLRVKWVNDILKNERKVCGILTEARSSNGRVVRVVVGIGINLKEPEEGFPEEIKDRAGAVGFDGDKLTLAANIAKNLGALVKKESPEIAKKYSESLAMIGQLAEVSDYADGAKKLKGRILGVDENCFLRLETENGIKTVSSGEICSDR